MGFPKYAFPCPSSESDGVKVYSFLALDLHREELRLEGGEIKRNFKSKAKVASSLMCFLSLSLVHMCVCIAKSPG